MQKYCIIIKLVLRIKKLNFLSENILINEKGDKF